MNPNRCLVVQIVGAVSGLIGGASVGVTLLDKLIALTIFPSDTTIQLLTLAVAGIAGAGAGVIGLAAAAGCTSDG